MCDGSTLDVACQGDDVMRVLSARYGRISEDVCSSPETNTTDWDLECRAEDSLDVVLKRFTYSILRLHYLHVGPVRRLFAGEGSRIAVKGQNQGLF